MTFHEPITQKPYNIYVPNCVPHIILRYSILLPSFVKIRRGAHFFCVDLAWNYPIGISENLLQQQVVQSRHFAIKFHTIIAFCLALLHFLLAFLVTS